MNKPSTLAIATVLAISAGLVNAASQIAPQGAPSSIPASPLVPAGIVAQGDSPEAVERPDASESEQAEASEPAGDPQDSETDTAPEASETTGK